MGRKGKCRICGNVLDTSIAYKVISNNKPAYYCSESEYEEAEEKKRKAAMYKEQVYRLICDVIDRKEIINTVLWKEWKTWNVVADDEAIAEYLEDNKDYLKLTINRLDNVEFNRIRYLSTVLKNALGDYKVKVKPVEKPKVVESMSDFTLFEPEMPKPTRIVGYIFEDVEDDLI